MTMTRRTFGQATIALAVAVSVPFKAALAKTGIPFRHRGEYAVLGFGERMMKQGRHTPFLGIHPGEAKAIIEKYGVRDDVSGITYIKVATYRAPNYYREAGEPTEQHISGGMQPLFSAMVTCLCSDGRVTSVRKNKLDGKMEVEHVSRFIPAAVHTTLTKTLLITTGVMSDREASVQVLS